MAPQPRVKSSSNEADIVLAMYAIDQQLLLSTRAAAKAYNVDSETLRHRRAGRPAR
jgi:hypothetical protein